MARLAAVKDQAEQRKVEAQKAEAKTRLSTFTFSFTIFRPQSDLKRCRLTEVSCADFELLKLLSLVLKVVALPCA